MEKQILIAVDDSASSIRALEYFASLFPAADDVRICLCHCTTGSSGPIPEPDDDRNSLLPEAISVKKKQLAGRCLNRSLEKLKDLGIDQSRITSTHITGSNTASSLLSHAEKGLYDAVLVARRGVGLMGELLLGSVSSSLFDKSRKTPLWILDGTVTSKKILVPVDGTPNSLLAIDHLSHIFSGRRDIEFYLFHARSILSSPPVCKPEKFYDKWGKDWCDEHLSGDGCLYTGPIELLTESGIPKESITPLPPPSAMEESTAIIASCKKYNCGTIVIGRRPESESKGFLGGVARRTVKQTENMALWVIG